MPRWALLLGAVAGLLILAACGASRVQLHEQDAGRTIELRRGDQLEVVLPGNPTAGYGWEWVDGDNAVLKSAGEPAFQPDARALGSGGVVTVPFEASGAGQTTLTLVYRRAFEPNVPPLKTFEVGIVVR
jgi:inhibitor of cysteine peptidase